MRQWLVFGASVRRVLLLLCFFLVATVAWLSWYGPGLDEFRPEIQNLLRNNLDLRELSFGRLSWSWTGHVWIKAEDLALTTDDELLHVKKADLAVRVSLLRLLFGDIEVKSVRVLHPEIKIRIPEQRGETGALSLPMFVSLEDADVKWRYGETSGEIKNLDLDFDVKDGELVARSPGVHLRLILAENRFPRLLELKWQNLEWLPMKFRKSFRGALSGEARAVKSGNEVWNVEVEVHGKGKTMLVDHAGNSLLPISSMRVLADVDWPISGSGPREVHFRELSWKSGRSHLRLRGRWKDRKIQLRMRDGTLSLPIMWPWLKGLGEEVWHAWLADMHEGWADNMQGELVVDWPELWKLPEAASRERIAFVLRASIVSADIALVPGEGRLTDVHAIVQLNQDGLRASVSKALLPRDVGQVAGDLLIGDWENIVLDMKGSGQIDVIALRDWLGMKEAVPDMELFQAPASGEFALKWVPEESEPRKGMVSIKPDPAWEIALAGRDVQLTGGTIKWDIEKGIRIEGVHIATEGIKGTVNLEAVPVEPRGWRLRRVDASARAELNSIVQKYRLPILAPEGEVEIGLHFDDARWSGAIDFQFASWRHWLGSVKSKGDPFSVSFDGIKLKDGFRLSSLASKGNIMRLSGHGEYTQAKKFLLLDKLETPAIDARLNLTMVDDGSLELSIDGKYLTQGFLPESTPRMRDLGGRKILIRLFLDQLNWGGAKLTGVRAKVSLPAEGVEHLRAKNLVISGLTFADVDAQFRRSRPNEIDIYKLSASLWQQKFLISAKVALHQNGHLDWKGFMQLQGDDFSRLLTEIKWSDRFQGGRFRALFLGRGEMAPDQPWWSGMKGRARLRVDDGRILEGGILTRVLAAASLADLPKLLLAQRKDLIGPGIHYKRLQIEADLTDRQARLRKAAFRASAFDLAGHGSMDLEAQTVDLLLVIRPFQNIDAIIGKIPLLRDVIGGSSRSVMRKIYHVHGPLSDAKVDKLDPKEAGLDSPGLLEALLSLPSNWFGTEQHEAPHPEQHER